MMPALTVEGIHLSIGGLKILQGASFSVPKGTLMGLIGPNGAGKTTLFNVISGIIAPDSGSVHFAGRDVTRYKPHRLASLGLMRTFQIARGFPRLSVFEHLMVYGQHQPGERLKAALFGGSRVWRREQEIAERGLAVARRLHLAAVIDKPITELSGGQKKLLEIGRALMSEPALILLDEPAAGVNPSLGIEIADHLGEIVREGKTILLIEHDMSLIERMCEKVVVLSKGATLDEGHLSEVRENPAVQDAYLGRQH